MLTAIKKAALTKEQMQEVMTKYEEKKQAEMMEKNEARRRQK